MTELTVADGVTVSRSDFWVTNGSISQAEQFTGQTGQTGGLVLGVGEVTTTYSTYTFTVGEFTYSYIGSWTLEVIGGVLTATTSATGSYDEILIERNGAFYASLELDDSIPVDFGSETGLDILGLNTSDLVDPLLSLIFGDGGEGSVANLHLSATPDLTDLLDEVLPDDATDGDDVIDGTPGADVVDGGLGDDIINGGQGNDILNGGAGNDTINGDEGNDTINGDDGNDILSGGVGNDVINGGNGDDIVNGDAGNDVLHGDAGNDTLNGGRGNDRLWGDAGNDIIWGNAGRDKLWGGDNDDIIHGGAGADKLRGDAGNDTLFGEGGRDKLWGGSGADTFVFSTGSGKDVIKDFSAGTDVIDVSNWGPIGSFAAVKSHAENHGHDVWIVAGRNTLIIEDTHKNNLSADDFLF